MNLSAVLLAGGRSARMGQDKALLELDGRPLWRIQLEKLRALQPAGLFISCRRDQNFDASDCELIPDPPGTNSAIEAITSCLHVVKDSILVLAVDLPRMSVEVLDRVVSHHEASGHGVVFRFGSRLEPLSAVYPLEMLALLDDAVARRSFGLQNALSEGIKRGLMDALALPAEFESAFFNTNTPDEWIRALQNP